MYARPTDPIGVFPGSFDPLTVAHLAIADAAVSRFGLARLDMVMSRVALAKEHGGHASISARVAAIEAAGRPWLRALVTDRGLIADIAEGYDVCVVGADKWHQLHDVSFYDSVKARDVALSRLPLVTVAPRTGFPLPGAGAVVLEVPEEYHNVSSTGARAGKEEWHA